MSTDSGSDKEQPQGDLDVEHNPRGPWANLNDENLQSAIVRLAGMHHAACSADNPKLKKFADFLDAFASAWLEQKAQVEKEAQKYGFAPCKSTKEIPAGDRHKVALLSLTLNGSFVLLGNGCLSGKGSFGSYEKIPFRKGDGATKINAPNGVVVRGEAEMNSRLLLNSLIGSTSPLQALYYTKENLPARDALELEEALSMSVQHFSQTFRVDIDETVRKHPAKDPGKHKGDQPDYIPKELPEFEPVQK